MSSFVALITTDYEISGSWTDNRCHKYPEEGHCLKNAFKKYDATCTKYRTAYTANNAQQNFVYVGNKSSAQQAG